MSADELRGLADRITLAEWVALTRDVLGRAYGEVEYAAVTARVGDGVPDVVLPVVVNGNAVADRG